MVYIITIEVQNGTEWYGGMLQYGLLVSNIFLVTVAMAWYMAQTWNH